MRSRIILQMLEREDGFVSGEALSKTLGISRAAVWKHIASLRAAGYGIEAVPSRGYRLASVPDALDEQTVRRLLTGSRIGRSLVCLPQTGSTNADAFQRAEDGAGEGTVVLAEAQTAGKGRRGRVWASPPGCNLYCSVILRPPIMPHAAPQLTFLSAVAVARAIEGVCRLSPRIKWPNDVLLQGRKVAGLLNEMSAETDAVNFIILGIGVNLNMPAELFPADLRYPATSLFIESGSRVDRAVFAATMLNELDQLYSAFLDAGFEPVREEWQRRCNAHGRQVEVSDSGQPTVCGAFAGIDQEGALLLQDRQGMRHRILSGDVRVLDDASGH